MICFKNTIVIRQIDKESYFYRRSMKLNYSRANSIAYLSRIRQLPIALPSVVSLLRARSLNPSCSIYPLQDPWFTSTQCFHPRENIQFASDARRDRAEILIGPFGFAITKIVIAKEKLCLSIFRKFYLRVWNRVRDFVRSETGKVDASRSWNCRIPSVSDLVL